jgi:hypothetical protein
MKIPIAKNGGTLAVPASNMHDNIGYAHCGPKELNSLIEAGKYVYNRKKSGYNPPLPFACAKPDHSWSVFKIGHKFYLECKQCNMLKLFFTDPA